MFVCAGTSVSCAKCKQTGQLALFSTNTAENKERCDKHGGAARPRPMIWVEADRKDLINLLPFIVENTSSPLHPISEGCVLGRKECNLKVHSQSFAFIPADREK